MHMVDCRDTISAWKPCYTIGDVGNIDQIPLLPFALVLNNFLRKTVQKIR